MNGRFQKQVKTGFCRMRLMQTGFSGTLIGWKSGQTSNMGPNRGSVAMDFGKKRTKGPLL
jgi:hypothetical protein